MIKAIAKLSPLILLLALSPAIFGQSLEAKLIQDHATYDSVRMTTLEQLVEVAQRFHIPMGIEWTDAPNERIVKPIHVRDTNVREIISKILDPQDQYRVAVVDGLLQVSTISIVDDPRNFLNVKLPIYAAKNKSLSDVSYWLQVRIKTSLHPERNFGGGFGGRSAQEDFNDPTITFSVMNATVRTILNTIVVAQGNSLWVVHLNPALLMEGEPFYAQAVSPTTGKGTSEFTWAFLPLLTKTTIGSDRNIIR